MAPAARAVGLAMLDRLRPGEWTLRERGIDGRVSVICLKNGREFIQLRHPGLNCDQLVIDDTASDVTVQYACRGRGSGYTHIHREADDVVQIETQGIASAMPFSFVLEGRQRGPCAH